jgi:RNA polymerase sigma factor (sigma-70 family)
MPDDTLTHRLLSADEEYALAVAMRNGDPEARATFILHNLRLALSLANAWTRNSPHDRDDVEQVAYVGLIVAVDKFEPDRGCRFSSMATWWIRQALQRWSDEQTRLIRLPVWIEEQARLVKRTRADLAVAHGVAPSWEAVQAATGLTQGQLALVRYGQAINDQWSLEATQIPGSDGLCLKDAVADPLDLEEAVADTDERREAHQTLAELLAPLPPRHRQVVILRYGLAGHEVHTLDQVGTVLGITRERARQLQAVAMTRIRQNLARKGAL